jgi:hypothetical protein
MKDKIKSLRLSKKSNRLNHSPKIIKKTPKNPKIENQIRASSDRLDFSFCSSNKRIKKDFNVLEIKNKRIENNRYLFYD